MPNEMRLLFSFTQFQYDWISSEPDLVFECENNTSLPINVTCTQEAITPMHYLAVSYSWQRGPRVQSGLHLEYQRYGAVAHHNTVCQCMKRAALAALCRC